MSVRVSARARRHVDRAGDPLDGLVNLFDLGIVLSVAFLLAALSSLHLSGALTKNAAKPGSKEIIRRVRGLCSTSAAPVTWMGAAGAGLAGGRLRGRPGVEWLA